MRGFVVLMLLLAGVLPLGRADAVALRCDPREHGAQADGSRLDTDAFQAAIDRCAAAGGGVVAVGAGRYAIGPITLRSRVTLSLAAGATLLGSTDQTDYPLVEGRYEGIETAGHAALISVRDAHDVAITGAGVVDGRGAAWWDDFERGALTHPRPHLIDIVRSTRVRVEGVTLRDSPSWTLHPLYSEDVTIRGVTIESPPDAPNTDGIDVDSSRDVEIAHCTIDVGDDCVAIKSGRDADGRRVGRPSENIRIHDCTMRHGHGGVVIGSETAGGVRDVRAWNLEMTDTQRGIRLKTRRGRGGTVEDIHVRGVRMRGVAEPLVVNMAYAGDGGRVPDAPQSEASTPRVRSIRLERIVADGAERAGRLRGLPEMPLANLTLRDIVLEASHGLELAEARDVVLENLELAIRSGPVLRARHVEGLRSLGLRSRSRSPWEPVWLLRAVRGARLHGGFSERSDVYLKLLGDQNRAIELTGTRVRHLGREVVLAGDVPARALVARPAEPPAPSPRARRSGRAPAW